MIESALSDTYLNTQDLIHHTIWRFCRKYGGDSTDLKSVSNTIFMEAARTHNPKLSKFTSWLTQRLWYGFMDALKKDIKYKTKEQRNTEIVLRKGYSIQNHFLFNIKNDLSREARDVLDLFIAVPREIQEVALVQGTEAKNLRKAVRTHLLDSGWTIRQVRTIFKEIKAVIHEY